MLRKRVFGVVKFMEDCLKAVQPHKQIGEELVPIETYDFDALRHKLGLEYVSAEPPKVNVPRGATDAGERGACRESHGQPHDRSASPAASRRSATSAR